MPADSFYEKYWSSSSSYEQTHSTTMEEPWRHYAEWNKPDTYRQILQDSTYECPE